MSKQDFTPGQAGTYEEKHDHPIKAVRRDTQETIQVRIMGKDEMVDDDTTYYADTNCSIYQLYELELQDD